MLKLVHLLFLLIFILVSSCSSMHQVNCPDFSGNPSFNHKKKPNHLPIFTKKNRETEKGKEDQLKTEEKKVELQKSKQTKSEKIIRETVVKPKRKYKRIGRKFGCNRL